MISFTLVGGQKEKPTLASFLIFCSLKIFSCLKEINTHLVNFEVSFKSFFKRNFENIGLISMKRVCLLFADLSNSFKRGTGLPSLVLISFIFE